jgi:predicted dehydrogenase
MLQVAQNYKSGRLALEEVPAPALRRGGVIVRTACSLVSSGTEAMQVRQATMTLVGKAQARPDQVRKVLDSVRRQGLAATWRAVMNRLDSLTPLGYSLAGHVTAVGEGAEEFREGQRVACGGVGYANHAEFNFVPKNLVVPVPDRVTFQEAACTTVGAVALQGFRQSHLVLGETVAVIGLGLVGQIFLQIARAAGCRTVGIDADPARVALAAELGADAACSPDPAAARSAVETVSGGLGADVVVLAVGTDSNAPLELAVGLARDRGRLVNIGKARIDVPYEPFFRKDLTLVYSRSYGPGRYDATYEEKGVDYPAGYVRWTERRNMAAFLDLVAAGRLNLAGILKEIVPFREAPAAYDRLRDGASGLGLLFIYPEADSAPAPVLTTVQVRPPRPQPGVVLACVGPGNYARTMLLPPLAAMKSVRLKSVAGATGLSAKSAALRFGFEQATTDAAAAVADEEVNAVVIATPHDSHARLAAAALRAGKAVFVEKPLATSAAQLEEIVAAARDSGNDRLMVGYNRRFAPLAVAARQAMAGWHGPVQILARINAGRLEGGRWTSDPEVSGGRWVGEGCHFVDLASFFVGESPAEVYAARCGAGPDDLSVTLRFRGGSVATILYVTTGGTRLPKEYYEIHGAGASMVLDDFRRAHLYGDRRKRLGSGRQDKGQAAELRAFCDAVVAGGPMPGPLTSLLATSRATLAAIESLRTGAAVIVD